MADPVLKLQIKETHDEHKELKDGIFETHTAEIIIGLCGPIGTDIHFIADSFKKVLEDSFHYKCKIIKLSDLIRRYSQINQKSSEKKSLQDYELLINKGNELRKNHTNSILAEIAINEIAVQRELLKGNGDDYKSERVCYIIDSIKNKEELELFKLIYRDLFYTIGVFSSLDNRQKFLEDKGMQSDEVFKLINRDSGEEILFGQKVSETFTESDFFLRIDKSTHHTIEPKLRRFLDLIFSSDIITPSAHETAMYLAAAAAGNSACLSRQVGASLTDENGELISVGWNDVPKAGGGVYQFHESDPTSVKDFRCMNLEGGICFNDKEKYNISKSLADELIDNKLITEENKSRALVIIRNSKIKELIEFSRAVHAEMIAIIYGSQKAGFKVRNGKLYCTTYPCHNCARHIVASGIKEVYYIEPYRKSLATKLHDDSITENESKKELVRILMYEGISPRRYLEFFKSPPNSRKKDGKKISSPTKEVTPKNTMSLQAIPILEKRVTESLKKRNLIEV